VSNGHPLYESCSGKARDRWRHALTSGLSEGLENGPASCTYHAGHFPVNRRQIELSHAEEDTSMTRDELQTNQEYMWQALSGKQRTTLILAVEMLSSCQFLLNGSLPKTMMALEGSQQDS